MTIDDHEERDGITPDDMTEPAPQAPPRVLFTTVYREGGVRLHRRQLPVEVVSVPMAEGPVLRPAIP